MIGDHIMVPLGWTEEFSVNIAEIDAQHMQLFALIQDLHNAMKQGKTKNTLQSTISGLSDYAVNHFTTEERLFDKNDYPDQILHKQEHDLFIQKALQFKEDFEQDRIMVSMKIMDFLTDWLINHIMKSDMQYIAFLNERGVK